MCVQYLSDSVSLCQCEFVWCQLMGACISEKYGGSALTFFSTILLIEEIAKVDMSVSVMVDVQNTLVTPVLEQHGTDAQKLKYLTLLCKDTVCLNMINLSYLLSMPVSPF